MIYMEKLSLMAFYRYYWFVLFFIFDELFSPFNEVICYCNNKLRN